MECRKRIWPWKLVAMNRFWNKPVLFYNVFFVKISIWSCFFRMQNTNTTVKIYKDELVSRKTGSILPIWRDFCKKWYTFTFGHVNSETYLKNFADEPVLNRTSSSINQWKFVKFLENLLLGVFWECKNEFIFEIGFW